MYALYGKLSLVVDRMIQGDEQAVRKNFFVCYVTALWGLIMFELCGETSRGVSLTRVWQHNWYCFISCKASNSEPGGAHYYWRLLYMQLYAIGYIDNENSCIMWLQIVQVFHKHHIDTVSRIHTDDSWQRANRSDIQQVIQMKNSISINDNQMNKISVPRDLKICLCSKRSDAGLSGSQQINSWEELGIQWHLAQDLYHS